MNPFTPSLAKIIWPFLLHTAIVLFSLWGSNSLPFHAPAGFLNPYLSPSASLPDKLVRWDAHWYTFTAEQGYEQQSIVFFPAIILLIRFLVWLGLDYAPAGLILCNIFALLSFGVMFAIFRQDYSERIASRALLAYAVMPTSFFLNSIYTESLFLTFALSSLYLARVNKWWSAGTFAALATLTRNLGVFLFLALAYEYWRQRRLSWSAMALTFPPAALLGFMAFNFTLLGNPLAFFFTQQFWGRKFGWPGDNFLHNLQLMPVVAPNTQGGITLDTFLVLIGLLALAAATFTRPTVRPSHLIVGWLWFIIPLFSTSSFLPLYSMSRFILVVFPLYLVVARLPSSLYYGYILTSALLLSLCTILFANWYWVG